MSEKGSKRQKTKETRKKAKPIDNLRKIIVSTLESLEKNADAVTYEKAIYNMCVRIVNRDGSKIMDVYSVVAYDKTGQLLNAGTKEERKRIFNDIQETLQDWSSSVYQEEKQEFIKTMDKSVQKPKATKGVYFCKQKGCNSDEFYMWSAQTRSGDEGSTQYRQCALCGKRRRE